MFVYKATLLAKTLLHATEFSGFFGVPAKQEHLCVRMLSSLHVLVCSFSFVVSSSRNEVQDCQMNPTGLAQIRLGGRSTQLWLFFYFLFAFAWELYWTATRSSVRVVAWSWVWEMNIDLALVLHAPCCYFLTIFNGCFSVQWKSEFWILITKTSQESTEEGVNVKFRSHLIATSAKVLMLHLMLVCLYKSAI